MKALVKYFIKYPFAGNLLAGVFILLGIIGFLSLNSSVMPQIDPGLITVSAAYPGASPQEVEKGVTLKIEDNIKGISGIEKITSVSKENSCVVTVKLVTDYDPNVALQDVKNAVDGISSFPVGVENISVSKQEFTAKALTLAISGDITLRDLKRYAREIENDFRQMSGISQISLSGFPKEEIVISVKEDALKAYNITINQIQQAIANENVEQTGGTIRGEDEQLRIRVREKQYYAEGFSDIVVRSASEGGTVYLHDVAIVEDKWSEDPNRVFINGDAAITIVVTQTSREDVLYISETLNAYVDKFNAEHEVVKLDVLYDYADQVRVMQEILADNGIIGFLLVLLFLSLFLNHRLSFWVALGIPISFLGMFMIAGMYGLTLNKVSLFGMIMVIGILVDDGIVICENIYQHYEKGKSALQAGIDGTLEVMPAVFSAVLTTIVAFSAFFFIDSVMGQFFQEMAFVVIFALVFSLVEAFLILPAHVVHSKALKRERKISKAEQLTSKIIFVLRGKIYEPLIRFCLANRFLTVTATLGVFILTLGAIGGGVIRTGDTSVDNSDYVNIDLEMPTGTPEHETMNYLSVIENAVWKVAQEYQKESETPDVPVVNNVSLTITASNVGQVTAYLVGSKSRVFLSSDFSNRVEKEVGKIPQAERVNYVLKNFFGKAVSISLQSSKLDDLNAAKNEFKEHLNKMDGLKNVLDNDLVGMREIKLKLKQTGYKLGLSLNDLTSQVRAGFFGKEVQRLQRGIDEVRVWVRYEKEERSSVGDLERMRIRTADGGQYYLSEVAEVIFERNLVQINHLGGQREITVEADTKSANVNLTEIKTQIDEVILPNLVKKYPGLRFRYSGREEDKKKAATSGAMIAPVVLILLFSIVIFTFRSFSQTAMIFLLVPLGLIGVGWGHWIHGTPIDMPSYLGIVALMGVMVNDSIVLISTFNERLRSGLKFGEAIYEAAVSRFRPIVLTSLTTVVGIAPLIASSASEAHIVIPMAISMAYGLIIATFLNLLLLPVLLSSFNTLRVRFHWLKSGEMPSRESVEPAMKKVVE